MAQNGDTGVKPQMLFDLLAHIHGAGGTLGHHDHEVGFAPQPGCADLLSHVLFKVILMLRYQHSGGPHGYAHIQSQIPGVTAHDLHHGAAFVGLHGVPQTVNALHGGIGGGIEADGIVGADDVVVDGTRHAHHGHAESGQILRPPEGAVAADGHDAVQPQQLAGVGGLLLSLRRAELVAAGGVENGAAPVDDAADAAGIHGTDIPGDKARPAPADAHALDAVLHCRPHHRTDGGVHAGGVAAAGQHADAFHCTFHIRIPLFSAEA